MKKLELVREIAKNTNMTQTQASQALDATLSIIKEALKNKEDVRLVGFGSFKVNTRKARTGVNPQTKKPMNIAASNVAKFVPGKELREMVNNKENTTATNTTKATTNTKATTTPNTKATTTATKKNTTATKKTTKK